MMKSRVFAIAVVSSAVVAIAAAAWLQPFSASRKGAGARATAQAPAVSADAARGVPEFSSYDLAGRAAAPATVPKAGVPQSRGTFTVVFREPALAAYRGGVPGVAAPKRRTAPGGRERLDAKSAEARQYVSYLQGRQRALERRIATANRESLPVRGRMQHALNAIVVDMTNAQAARVARMPEVLHVEPERHYTLAGDVGPALIGAGPVWNGSNAGALGPYQGEGMVLGVIDSGINFGSPSFAGVDPVDGYVHVNPLGAGNFLGTCAAGGIDAGRCNAKLIGGHDFVCGPPANQCGEPNVREEPGFADTDRHGTEVASIAVGNRRDVSYVGVPLRISGVAPRANVIAYDVCLHRISSGVGFCPSSALLAGMDQVVADGVVDVLNMSLGSGPDDPWLNVTPLALANVVAAGTHVVAGAGNSGPTASTVSNTAPWISSIAASQHGRGDFFRFISATGPAPVPVSVSSILLYESFDGAKMTADIVGTTRLRSGTNINDGCSAFVPNYFAGAIAVVRRAACSPATQVNNAAAAGAVAVIIANTQNSPLWPVTPGTSIPSFGVTLTDGTALRNFASANATATARILFRATPFPNQPDVLAWYSSRGPAKNYDLIKPDLTAPGVSILAASAGDTPTGFETLVVLTEGTSMATPQVAGAALLVRQARPAWTSPEVQSALMMTAKEQVLSEDEVTPADPHARGSGRVRVDRAINAGLVLNESTANFQAANPASGGSPSALNLASMADATCANSCSFTRTFRNARTYGALWRVQLQGLNGTVQSLLWVPMGGSASLPVTINTAGLPANGTWNFGTLVLTELFTGAQVSTSSELRLPIGVVVPTGGASLSFAKALPAGTAGNRLVGD
jgi:hypothetical protein